MDDAVLIPVLIGTGLAFLSCGIWGVRSMVAGREGDKGKADREVRVGLMGAVCGLIVAGAGFIVPLVSG